MLTLALQQEERARGRVYHRKASTIHGWIVKMRGTFFGSEATRREGISEMKAARALRRYKKEHPERFRKRRGSGGLGNVLWIFPRRSRRGTTHHDGGHAHSHSRTHSSGRHHSSSGRHGSRHGHHGSSRRHHGDRHRHGAYYGESHDGPCLHFHHRVHQHHHGGGTLIAGMLTGKQNLKEKGRYLRQRAAKERKRERHCWSLSPPL